MDMGGWEGYERSFRERMEDGKEAALLRDTSRHTVLVKRRLRLVELVDVEQAAELLGVSRQRLRLLLGQGRIVGAYRARKGRASWRIPLTGGKPTIASGTRGPQLRLTRHDPIPF